MLYRDLVPSRLGGAVIASHIRVPGSGPVPDWVHFHRVAFQMIFCRRGRVRLVYEDQGPPFELEPGDCVLQPPEIRHRVLESDGLEVVEVTCPSAHETVADEEMTLPTEAYRPDRRFGGQVFVRHRAREAAWRPTWADGFEARDTGIGEATGGVARARVVRGAAGARVELPPHGDTVRFLFVLEGAIALAAGEARARLAIDESAVVPPGVPWSFETTGPDEVLEVVVPRGAA